MFIHSLKTNYTSSQKYLTTFSKLITLSLKNSISYTGEKTRKTYCHHSPLGFPGTTTCSPGSPMIRQRHSTCAVPVPGSRPCPRGWPSRTAPLSALSSPSSPRCGSENNGK